MPPKSNLQNNDFSKPTITGEHTPRSSVLIRASQRFPKLTIIAALLIPPLGLIIALVVGMKSKRPKRASLITTLLMASTIGIFGYLTMGTGLINLPTRSRINYQYQNTNANEFSPASVGGLSFSKPAEFSTAFKKTDKSYDIVALTHKATNGYPIGYIMAISFKNDLASDQKYIHDANAVMALASGNPQQSKYISDINHQVFDSYRSAGYSVTLSGKTKFTNTNIKDNAWSFDLVTTNANSKVEPMQGRLIYIIAPGTFYYMSVMTVKGNWGPNQATWQQMAQSLKVN